jgi:hypothetical protein
MSSHIYRFLVGCSLIFTINQTLNAQSPSRVELLLDADVTAMALIDSPTEALDFISTLDFWRDEYLATALNLAIDERWELLPAENLGAIQLALGRLKECFALCRSLTIVLHRVQDDAFEITVLFQFGEGQSVNFMDQLIELNRLLSSSNENPDAIEWSLSSWLPTPYEIDQFGDWIAISNSPKDILTIRNRAKSSANDSDPKILANRKRYQNVWNLLLKDVREQPNVILYANPEKLGFLFPDVSPEQWKANQIDEATAVLARGDFLKQPYALSDVDNHIGIVPVISTQILVAFTEPLAGMGKTYASKREIQAWPPLPKYVRWLNAEAYSAKAHLDVKKEVAIARSGPQGWNDFLDRYRQTRGTDYQNDTLARCSNIEVYYWQPGGHPVSLMNIEQVADFELAKQYFNAIIDTENKGLPENARLIELESEEGQLFGRTDNGRRAFIWHQFDDYKEEERESLLKFDRNDAFFLSDRWLIKGPLPDIRYIVSQLAESNPSECPALLQIAAGGDSSSNDEIVRYRYFTPSSWSTSHYEYKRATEKFKRESNFNYWSLPANKDGYRLNIESKEDAVAVIKSLIAKSIAKSFGGQLITYSMSGRILNVKYWIGSSIDDFPEAFPDE